MPFDVIAAALSATLLGLTLLGLAVRYVLMPYLREHLIQPVKETRKQVTENHHSNEVPTVLDRIDDVANQVAENTRETRENTRETRAMARMFDGHLEWSQREVDRIWQRLEEDERRRREER